MSYVGMVVPGMAGSLYQPILWLAITVWPTTTSCFIVCKGLNKVQEPTGLVQSWRKPVGCASDTGSTGLPGG
jgi:hypothetical protein